MFTYPLSFISGIEIESGTPERSHSARYTLEGRVGAVLGRASPGTRAGGTEQAAGAARAGKVHGRVRSIRKSRVVALVCTTTLRHVCLFQEAKLPSRSRSRSRSPASARTPLNPPAMSVPADSSSASSSAAHSQLPPAARSPHPGRKRPREANEAEEEPDVQETANTGEPEEQDREDPQDRRRTRSSRRDSKRGR